jgi:uncharacterized membrane protein
MIMSITEFIQTYFVDPYIQGIGYNPVNTLVLGLALVGFVYLLYEKIVPRLNIKLDHRFMTALVPFIFFIALIRVYGDVGYFSNILLKTPVVEILFGIPTFLFVALLQRRTKDYVLRSWQIASVLCAAAIIFFRLNNPSGLGYFLLFISISGALVYFLSKYLPFLRDRLSQYVMFSHMIDATATFVTLQFFSYKFYEEHVLANSFISIFGPVGMYVMKFVVLLPILYLIYKYEFDEEFSNLLKIIFAVFGLAAGLRSALLLIITVV